MIITARSNERVKFLRKLFTDKKLRRSENIFIAEGRTLVGDMPDATKVRAFFIRRSEEEKCKNIVLRFSQAEVFVLEDGVFDTVSDTVSPSGIIALIEPKEVAEVSGELTVILDGISDAGNMGTVIRTASAAGVKNILCINDCTDPYSPKAVRASMGGVFYVGITETDAETALKMTEGYTLVAMDMGGESLFSYRKKGKTAIIIGSEAHGVSRRMREAAEDTVAIPMEKEGVESLNAGVAAGIAIYMLMKGE